MDQAGAFELGRKMEQERILHRAREADFMFDVVKELDAMTRAELRLYSNLIQRIIRGEE